MEQIAIWKMVDLKFTVRNSEILTTSEYTDDMKEFSKSFVVVISNSIGSNASVKTGDYGTIIAKSNNGDKIQWLL